MFGQGVVFGWIYTTGKTDPASDDYMCTLCEESGGG